MSSLTTTTSTYAFFFNLSLALACKYYNLLLMFTVKINKSKAAAPVQQLGWVLGEFNVDTKS
jgi:hypothetical protein